MDPSTKKREKTRFRVIGNSTYVLVDKSIAKILGLKNMQPTTFTVRGNWYCVRLPDKKNGDIDKVKDIISTSRIQWTLDQLCYRVFGNITPNFQKRCRSAVECLVANDFHCRFENGVVFWTRYKNGKWQK